MKRTIEIKVLILIILIINFFGAANRASAQATKGVSLSPVTFELTANPGDILTNKIKVFNPSSDSVIIKMEVENFKAVGETGQVIVTDEEETVYSLKRWVKAEPAEFTLEPNEQKFVDFTIMVPENAEPGGKYGSILATVGGIISEQSSGAAVVQKVGALLLLSVAGEVKESLTVEKFSAPDFSEYGPVPFVIKFANEGSVHVRPRGFITITNWWGKKAADVEFSQLNVLPGSTREVDAKWNEKWLLGKYTATLVGIYGTGNISFVPPVITFWVIPWKIILVILAVLLIIFLFFFKTRRRWKLAMKALVKGNID